MYWSDWYGNGGDTVMKCGINGCNNQPTTLVSGQPLSGLFNRDDVAFSGPLAHLASERWSDRIGDLHDMNFDLLLVLIGLHVLVVLLHLRRGDDLLRPMLGGGRALEPVRTTPAWIALLILAACAAALWLDPLKPERINHLAIAVACLVASMLAILASVVTWLMPLLRQ